jgi:hypothetical protein
VALDGVRVSSGDLRFSDVDSSSIRVATVAVCGDSKKFLGTQREPILCKNVNSGDPLQVRCWWVIIKSAKKCKRIDVGGSHAYSWAVTDRK